MITRGSGFRLEFIPMEIGAGMTFLEVPYNVVKDLGSNI